MVSNPWKGNPQKENHSPDSHRNQRKQSPEILSEAPAKQKPQQTAQAQNQESFNNTAEQDPTGQWGRSQRHFGRYRSEVIKS